MTAPVDCAPGFYCESGTRDQTPCRRGFICPQRATIKPLPCPKGSFCPNTTMAAATPCPAGRYGDREELTSDACSGPAAAGYYTTRGSDRATQFACGAPSLWCPPGSKQAQPIPDGRRGVGPDPEHYNSTIDCPRGTLPRFEAVRHERTLLQAIRVLAAFRLNAIVASTRAKRG